MTPDTNACENAIRPFVVGRKNWLFSGSPAPTASATLYSLIETAKANGKEPYWYLRKLFEGSQPRSPKPTSSSWLLFAPRKPNNDRVGFVGRLRIPYSTFLKIESGYTPNPSIQAVLNIAEALSVSIDELVGREQRAEQALRAQNPCGAERVPDAPHRPCWGAHLEEVRDARQGCRTSLTPAPVGKPRPRHATHEVWLLQEPQTS